MNRSDYSTFPIIRHNATIRIAKLTDIGRVICCRKYLVLLSFIRDNSIHLMLPREIVSFVFLRVSMFPEKMKFSCLN